MWSTLRREISDHSNPGWPNADQLVRAVTSTMAVVLLAFWSTRQLWTWWSPPLDALVFSVVLAIGLPRAIAAIPRRHWSGAALAIPASVVISTSGAMLLNGDLPQFVAGAAAFSAAAFVSVWLRRFGPSWRAAGIAAGLPLMAILVQPLPLPRTWGTLGWMLCGAGIAMTWALALALLAGAASSAPPTPAPRFTGAPPTVRRVAPSTRQAIQLFTALAVTFAFARLVDPDHLVWPVLTVLLVSSGNRDRGDVAAKGAQRMIGALAGTAIATWLASGLEPGDSRGLVAVFAILALSAALRPFGYLYWAAGITGALAFLYGYFGQGGADLLGHRLLGIAVGSAAAILAAWFVFPIRARTAGRELHHQR